MALGRGTAAGDADHDGDLDVLVVNSGTAAELLENGSAGGAWVGVAAPGSRRAVTTGAAGPARTRRLARDGSYASAGDPRTILPLPAGDAVALTLTDVAGKRRLYAPPGGHYLRFRERVLR